MVYFPIILMGANAMDEERNTVSINGLKPIRHEWQDRVAGVLVGTLALQHTLMGGLHSVRQAAGNAVDGLAGTAHVGLSVAAVAAATYVATSAGYNIGKWGCAALDNRFALAAGTEDGWMKVRAVAPDQNVGVNSMKVTLEFGN